jgi:spermidine synthase
MRTPEPFDLIVIDPPPPVEAAGSSLLCSMEFIELVRARLRPDGVLMHWYPEGKEDTLHAVTRTLRDVFPHVRAFRSVEGWGNHLMASTVPLTVPNAEEFLARMPVRARSDISEWTEFGDARTQIARVLSCEVPFDRILGEAFTPVLTRAVLSQLTGCDQCP